MSTKHTASTTRDPRLGDTVRYVGEDGTHYAATITEVMDTGIGLAVLTPTDQRFYRNVPHDPKGKEVGSWHWSEED